MKPFEKQILENRLKDFMNDVIPTELLPYLACLTQSDKEEIQATEMSRGPIKATFVLVDRLTRRDEGFQQFVRALRRCGCQHIALMLDSHYENTCEGRAEVSSEANGRQMLPLCPYRGVRRARIRGELSQLSGASITGPDQLISTIPFRVYSRLAFLLARDRIDLASRLCDLTFEEAMVLRDITDHTTNLRHSMDIVFELMSERQVRLGELVQVLREMRRFDAISVLIEAGYSGCTLDESSDQEAVGCEDE